MTQRTFGSVAGTVCGVLLLRYSFMRGRGTFEGGGLVHQPGVAIRPLSTRLPPIQGTSVITSIQDVTKDLHTSGRHSNQ